MATQAYPIEETIPTSGESSPEDSFRLARFVAVLALDRERLHNFRADPDAEMTAADLTPRERGHLAAESFINLCDYLWEVGEKPCPDEETGGT